MNQHKWRVDRDTFRAMVKDATFTWQEFKKVSVFMISVILGCVLMAVLVAWFETAHAAPDYTGHPQRGPLTDSPSPSTSDQGLEVLELEVQELGAPVARPLTECDLENKRTGRHVRCPVN